jgi:divalent metal cation (Fe/Co/Zn/Cd) transporter
MGSEHGVPKRNPATGNEVFLMIANRRSRRPSDAEHPIGYGKEAYVWSLFAALGLLVAGSVVSIMRGFIQISPADERCSLGELTIRKDSTRR